VQYRFNKSVYQKTAVGIKYHAEGISNFYSDILLSLKGFITDPKRMDIPGTILSLDDQINQICHKSFIISRAIQTKTNVLHKMSMLWVIFVSVIW
jgi:hypothetical protein